MNDALGCVANAPRRMDVDARAAGAASGVMLR